MHVLQDARCCDGYADTLDGMLLAVKQLKMNDVGLLATQGVVTAWEQMPQLGKTDARMLLLAKASYHPKHVLIYRLRCLLRV